MDALMVSGLIVALSGVLFALVSIPFFLMDSRMHKNCTARTTGQVIGYVCRGKDANTSVAPKVQFEVDGKTYKAYRHYKAVISTHKSTLNPKEALGQNDYFWVDENDNFHIKTRGKIHNFKKLGEEVWPLGTELPVVYNPAKPKQAYVEKPVGSGKIAGFVMLGLGALIMLIGVIFMCV